MGKDKAKNFVVVKERVSAKVAGWKSKLLLQAGRTTLVKFVATSFPQYYMQSYLFPVGWCKDVNRILKNFWLGLSPDKTHDYMSKAWTTICQPKSQGGLGLRCMGEINQAFIQKLAWLLLSKLDFLWVQLLKAKYFPNSNLLDATPRPSASLVWQGICKVLDTLRNNIYFIPRNGSTIHIRKDPWIPCLTDYCPVWHEVAPKWIIFGLFLIWVLLSFSN